MPLGFPSSNKTNGISIHQFSSFALIVKRIKKASLISTNQWCSDWVHSTVSLHHMHKSTNGWKMCSMPNRTSTFRVNSSVRELCLSKFSLQYSVSNIHSWNSPLRHQLLLCTSGAAWIHIFEITLLFYASCRATVRFWPPIVSLLVIPPLCLHLLNPMTSENIMFTESRVSQPYWMVYCNDSFETFHANCWNLFTHILLNIQLKLD